MLMNQWEFRIVPCLAGGNASATFLKMLVMRFADAPMSLLRHFAAQYKSLVISLVTKVFVYSILMTLNDDDEDDKMSG